ncbi:hypothetical protein NIES2119_19150 [[Phormidium ambiguum] IAM M-71]|uniref:Uncharacterized protein n=1 Tax=[Phormidium ambiguum] IAM M-71 TaxID=454136 RepID=A0A1U7IFU5_9CYAN|nr:hypothetical protein NIES2119_19150 [Phormidium ambiguum IAM M-71]
MFYKHLAHFIFNIAIFNLLIVLIPILYIEATYHQPPAVAVPLAIGVAFPQGRGTTGGDQSVANIQRVGITYLKKTTNEL